ncbi:50S ribosomal protein L32 [Myceligenerans indicum]|uniref:Large ribosomal subunit protein bL32 n=1 Tax=Myceligenerans indicum TaxID=2593663 RepID=A0ABS1LLA6_9MICO|nr:50S ribosomal protein L32 [Myceligenerans indicum]MBL0887011.1 50S ribosomal protein L32 [Myceligenerans indicum]
MAVPKRKMSRSRTRSRRSRWTASLPGLVEVGTPDRGVVQVPRRLVRAARLGLL